MELKYSSRQLLSDIKSMKSHTKQLFGKGKKYEHFLRCILNLNYFRDDVYTPISLKEIQKVTGLKYPIVRKYLHQIYQDLLKHEENHLDFSVQKVQYNFIMYYFNNEACLTVNHLPVVPRVGEQVEIPFFKAKVGRTTFFVKSIDHLFLDDMHRVDFILAPGNYNYYWHLRKDEAYLKGEISIEEYFSERDYRLQEKLRL